jgi:hypothetical protein
MKKNQFIEIVKGILTGGDDSPDLQEKYHEARINLVASMAFNNIIYETFRLRLDEKDLYVRDFTVDVELNTDYDEYYALLPSPVVQLPRNSGIHKISPLKEKWSFNPIVRLAEDIFDELEVNDIDENPSYYLGSDRVVFQFFNWKQEHTKKVRMALVLPFESYKDTDEVVIPAGKEDLILQFVTQYMSKQNQGDDAPNLNETQR